MVKHCIYYPKSPDSSNDNTWMRWNTVKTFSVCWSRGWVRQRKISKISESSFYKKEITHHIVSICEYLCVPGIYTQSRLHIDETDSRYQKTVFFYSPSWEAAFPDACWNQLGSQTCTLPLCQPLASSWPWKIHFSSPSPSLLICKMKLLIHLSFAQSIWDALISHEIGRKTCETSYTHIYNPKWCIMEMRAGKTF